MIEFLEPLLSFIRSLRFFAIVNAWEGAIHLRWGHLHRVLTPGFWWTIPIADTVWVVDRLTVPKDIGPLPLTTKDGISVTVSAVVTWEVLSVERFQTSCSDPAEALHDVASGTLAHAVMASEWDAVPTEPFLAAVCTEVRKRARKYGIRVLSLQWTGCVQARPVVLWTIGATPGAASHVMTTKLTQGE